MITVIVTTKNEEDRIEVCLKSVKWADEIIILDNGSTDQTINLARKYTDKVFKYQDLDFSSWRNTGMEKATNEWVLYIDPDERVLKDLKEEVLELIKKDNFNAYAIPRRNIIFGTEVNYGPFAKDWVIRLLKKSTFETWVGRIHEYPKFQGKLGYARNSLLHLTHRSVDQFMQKVMEWSKVEASLRKESNHPKMSKWRFIRILITEFFHQGIKRKGFFAGTVGFIDSVLQSFHLFITYVRLWELQQPKPLDKIYDEIDDKLIKNDFTNI